MRNVIMSCLVVLASFASSAQARDAEVLRLINEGNIYLDAGDTFQANISFVNAKGRAADVQDWEGMLDLADRFLTIESEWHGKDCFLIATQIAQSFADGAASSGDPEGQCDYAINALSFCALSWEAGLIDIAMSVETSAQIENMARIAGENSDWYERNGCP